MKVRSLIIAILTGVIALSIVGANAHGWAIEHRSILLLNRTIKQPPATAIFVPKNASVVISLLANLGDLGNLHRLATPGHKKRAIADIVFYPTADRTIIPQVQPDKSIAALKYLPSQSKIAIAGIDLGDWRGQLTNIVPPLKQLLSTVDLFVGTISTQIGIDLTKDIFSWATGEYALAAIPHPSHKAMDSTIKAIDKKSVLDSDRYRHAIDLINANQTGYLYGNWDTIESLLPKQPLIKSFAEGILSGLPNISLNSYTEAGTQRVTILFQVN